MRGEEETWAEESEEDGYLYVLWPWADEGRVMVGGSTDSGKEEGHLYVPCPCVGRGRGRLSESDARLCADGSDGERTGLTKDSGIGVRGGES